MEDEFYMDNDQLDLSTPKLLDSGPFFLQESSQESSETPSQESSDEERSVSSDESVEPEQPNETSDLPLLRSI